MGVTLHYRVTPCYLLLADPLKVHKSLTVLSIVTLSVHVHKYTPHLINLHGNLLIHSSAEVPGIVPIWHTHEVANVGRTLIDHLSNNRMNISVDLPLSNMSDRKYSKLPHLPYNGHCSRHQLVYFRHPQ